MDDDWPISPRHERWWTRAKAALLYTGMAVIALAPSGVLIVAFRSFNDVAMGFGALGMGVVAMSPMLVADCLGPAVVVGGEGQRFLSARTMSGTRFVDLSSIALIRYRAHFRLPTFHLIVRDTYGNSLCVPELDRPAIGAIRTAVHDAGEEAAGRITVSKTAKAVLELHGPRWNRTCRDRGILASLGLCALGMASYVVVGAALFDR